MFGRKKTDEAENKQVQSAQQPDTGQQSPKQAFTPSTKTVIADGVSMVGDFVTSDPIEIKGDVQGTIFSDSTMHVAQSGVLHGEAKVSELTVDGTVDGSMVVDGLASISNTGVVKGSLQTARFASQPGSVFDGTFTMAIAKKKETEQE